MQILRVTRRFGEHRNAFGFLRLLLASLVIVAHTAEIADGDRKRELLTRLFGSISFGEFAVDGFFILSGFLIAASFLSDPSLGGYLTKRIARIFPGYIICSIICMVLVGPLGGGYPHHSIVVTVTGAVVRGITLSPPLLFNSFSGTHYPALNGSAWTLQYEFLCYALVLAFGLVGILRSTLVVVGWAVILLVIHAIMVSSTARLPGSDVVFVGNANDLPRLLGLFFSGSAFYLLQARIPLSKSLAVTAFGALCLCLTSPVLATIGFAIFGSYVLFAAAALGAGTPLERINNKADISYGLYLYAWPIEKLLFWWHLSGNLVILGLATWLLAIVAGTLSWYLVEAPIMRWARRIARPGARSLSRDASLASATLSTRP